MSASLAFDYSSSELSDEARNVLETRAIAPLVASAHGLFEIDPQSVKQAALRLAFPDPTNGRSGPVRHLRASTSNGALGLPWFAPASVLSYIREKEAGHADIQPQPSFGQWRPYNPGPGPKYLMAKDTKITLGVHPATPLEWLKNPSSIIFAEGLFKCLATISAHLKEAGISESLLNKWLPAKEAVEELSHIMGSLDPEHRVLVVGFISVTTWNERPEWADIPVRQSTSFVAFDADVSKNANVWNQAHRLWAELERRRSTPYLLTPTVEDSPTAGIDDYLASGGLLSDLLSQATTQLPPSPGEAIEDGALRINDKMARVEKASVDETGMALWKADIPLGGRVVSIDTRRAPNAEEMETGRVLQLQKDSFESQDVEIEVTWRTPGSSDVETAIISGPMRILSEDPRNWARINGVLIPSEVQLLPQWPPNPTWLAAVKGNHKEDVEKTNTWMTMGWVPTSTTPHFIAGRDVMGPHGLTDDVRPGVTSGDLLNAATSFGLELPESPEQLRSEIETVLDLYTAQAWQNPAIAGIVLAAALRPVVPIRTITTVALAGPPNAGKSWTISRGMSFWQAKPGAFLSNLPGSAEDSIASTEQSLARSFIWVLDDAAAQATRQRSEQITENVNQAIRTTFNGTGRGRSTIDGQQRLRSNPQALLFVSAENFTGVESIQQRTALISVTRGEFLSADREPTNAIVEYERTTLGNNHIASAAVRMVARHAADTSWQECRQSWRLRLTNNHRAGESVIKQVSPQSDRGADVAADLALGLDVLADLAEDVNVDDAHMAIIEDLREKLFRHIAVMWRDQTEMSGGRRLIRALAAMLQAGEVSVAAPGLAIAPFADLDSSNPWRRYLSDIHQRLGWTPAQNSMPAQIRARDRTVGVAIMAGDEPVVLFDSQTAFKYAAQSRPDQVSPGQRAPETWSQVWSENIPSTEWARRSGNGGRPRVQVRVMLDGVVHDGVPIPLRELFEWPQAEPPHPQG